MLSRFYPDDWVDSAYQIDYEKIYDRGYRGLIFDIDNTLVPHGAPADERAIALFARLKNLGFSCCLLSNNQMERVSSFNEPIQVFFIENAHKPSAKNYRRAMEMMGTDEKNTLFIGDQLLRTCTAPNGRGFERFWFAPSIQKKRSRSSLNDIWRESYFSFINERGRREKGESYYLDRIHGLRKDQCGKQAGKGYGTAFCGHG